MTDPVYVPDDVYPKISRYIVDVGDVLVTIAGTIGEVAIVKERFHGASLTENAVKIKVSRKVCLEEYLSYYLQVDFVHEHLNLIAAGAAQPKLGLYKIRGFRVQLPNLSVQKKVVQILSAYDQLIENNLKRIKLLEEKAQQTYVEWFVRMRFPGHESTPIDPVTELPRGWDWQQLTSLFHFKYGKNLPKSQICPVGKYPVYGASGPMGFYHDLNVDRRSVLITCRGNGSGNVHRTFEKESFVTNNSFIASSKNPDYGFGYILETLVNINLTRFTSGSAQPQLTLAALEGITSMVPSLDLIVKFRTIADGIFDLSDRLREQNHKLKQARDILLPRLMTGMIDVEELGVELPITA